MTNIFYSVAVVLLPFLSLIIFVLFNKNKRSYDFIFRLMLAYILFTEVAGTIFADFLNIRNYAIYNLYCFFFPLLNYWLFSKIISSEIVKNRIKILSIVLVLIFIVENIIAKNFFTDMQQYTFLISTIFLIYIISAYLVQLLRSDEIQYFNRSKSFWISLGLLLFSVPFIPIILAFRFVIFNGEFRIIINLLLIVAMHSCFIYAILGSKHE